MQYPHPSKPMAINPMNLTPILGIGLLACVPPAQADEPSATPYRPTISNPAELSAPGWLEVEFGAARAKGGQNQWQNNLPYTLKYAFSPDFGILLGGDLHASQTDWSGQETSGRGDNTLLFKHRFGVDERNAFGLEWGAKLPSAAAGVGSGQADYIVNGIYSVDIGETRIDTNLGATRIGLEQVGLGRDQYSWATAVSREVVPRWTLAGELSGTARRGMTPTAQFLAAASYAVSNRLVLDGGAAAGLNRATPDWTVFAGLTWLVGKIH